MIDMPPVPTPEERLREALAEVRRLIGAEPRENDAEKTGEG